MHILRPDQYDVVGDLTVGLRDQGMALSIPAGVRPGVVAVSNVARPTAFCMGAPEGTFAWTYLVGDPGDRVFREELSRWLFEDKGLGADVAFSFLTCDRPE